MSFRDADGKQIRHENTGFDTGFSNFQFVGQHYGDHPVMRRIFSLARKHTYQSLVVDEIPESDCALLAEENTALRVRRPDFQRSDVHRVSFFRCTKEQTHTPGDFLGYVVFKQDHFANEPKLKAHVFESVLAPFRSAADNNFVHCPRDYEVNTSLGKFKVSGVLYAQQNDLTFVCAHVGLRSVLAAVLPDADITYAKLNGLVGVDHKTRTVGGGVGLPPKDIEAILTALGVDFSKVVHEPSQNLVLPTDYQRDLYGYIESGWPALVGFELDKPLPGASKIPRHVIPVFGHTFNDDTWMPDAQRAYFGGTLGYYPSENWLSSFVVHDDNFGPYLCVPRHFLKKDNFRIMYGLKRHKTEYGAVDAEAAGFTFLEAISKAFPTLGLDWYDRFAVFTKCGWLVLRTILVRKSEYVDRLKNIHDREGASLGGALVQKLQALVPDCFWMVEASAPELFSVSRRKFGEVLLVANKPLPKPLNPSVLLAARLPGFALLGESLAVERTKLTGHTPLFGFEQ